MARSAATPSTPSRSLLSVSIISVVVGLGALFWTLFSWSSKVEPVSPAEVERHTLAAAQNYTSTMVLDDPLVVYLDDFLSLAEVDEILNISSSLFVPSQVYGAAASEKPHRTSSSCLLPATHPLTGVISTRALQFLDKLNASPQGSDAVTTPSLSYYGLEDIQLVKYLPTQYFFHHVDWFDTLLRDTSPKGKGRYYNRVASFFLYLQDDCTGGETEFPDLHFKTEGGAGQEEETEQQQFWRERVDLQKGISFKPRTGSGIFWVNLLPVGYGDERVRHAGLPVQQGNKMGMNIWVKRDFGW